MQLLPDDLPVHFRDHAVEGGMLKYVAHHPSRRVDSGKFGRKVVLAVDGGEGLVANATADGAILWQGAANLEGGIGHGTQNTMM